MAHDRVLRCVRHFQVRVHHSCEVAHARIHADVIEQAVVARVVLHLAHGALRIVLVAKGDRAGRARLLARALEAVGRHLHVCGVLCLHLRGDLRLLDALHAERAFSMTPRMRTVTFGFFDIFNVSGIPFSLIRFHRKYFSFERSLKSKKLKRRTLKGQLFAQYACRCSGCRP